MSQPVVSPQPGRVAAGAPVAAQPVAAQPVAAPVAAQPVGVHEPDCEVAMGTPDPVCACPSLADPVQPARPMA